MRSGWSARILQARILAQEKTPSRPNEAANALVQTLTKQLSSESGGKAPPLIGNGQIVVPIITPLNVNEHLGGIVSRVQRSRTMIL